MCEGINKLRNIHVLTSGYLYYFIIIAPFSSHLIIYDRRKQNLETDT